MKQTMTGFLIELLWALRVRWYMLCVLAKRAARWARAWLRRRTSAHDRHWQAHPAVATGDALTLGQRAADLMRGALGTWTFLFALSGVMALWIITGGAGHDPEPYILLNLCLSTLAGVQAAVLLIAAKRADQIAAATALHTLQNTERQAEQLALLEQINRQQLDILTALHAQPVAQPVAQSAESSPESAS